VAASAAEHRGEAREEASSIASVFVYYFEIGSNAAQYLVLVFDGLMEKEEKTQK
jgi:hypothetical protein